MGYSSGFGLIASPYTTLTDLSSDDAWLVISSDGLFTEEKRGDERKGTTHTGTNTHIHAHTHIHSHVHTHIHTCTHTHTHTHTHILTR